MTTKSSGLSKRCPRNLVVTGPGQDKIQNDTYNYGWVTIICSNNTISGVQIVLPKLNLLPSLKLTYRLKINGWMIRFLFGGKALYYYYYHYYYYYCYSGANLLLVWGMVVFSFILGEFSGHLVKLGRDLTRVPGPSKGSKLEGKSWLFPGNLGWWNIIVQVAAFTEWPPFFFSFNFHPQSKPSVKYSNLARDI